MNSGRHFTWFTLGALLATVVVSGCATEPPPGPREAPRPSQNLPSAPEPSCDPHHSVPQKIKGDPAFLTPEAVAAGMTEPTPMNCFLTLQGRLVNCRALKPLPPSLEASIKLTLKGWRFRPAMSNGIPLAAEHLVTVPLVAPPSGWTLPSDEPKGDTISLEEGASTPELIPDAAREHPTRTILGDCKVTKIIARCTMTTEGKLTDCTIKPAIPFHLEQRLRKELTRTFPPVMLNGRPQAVMYTLTFKFKDPYQ